MRLKSSILFDQYQDAEVVVEYFFHEYSEPGVAAPDMDYEIEVVSVLRDESDPIALTDEQIIAHAQEHCAEDLLEHALDRQAAAYDYARDF